MLTQAEIIEKIKETLAIDGTHTWADMVELLKADKVQLFLGDHGAWITEIYDWPTGLRTLHAWIIAGELPGVCDIQDQVIQFAREKKCHRITGLCRRGWTKFLTDKHGWKTHEVFCTHEV
jgi:hypothetical protein